MSHKRKLILYRYCEYFLNDLYDNLKLSNLKTGSKLIVEILPIKIIKFLVDIFIYTFYNFYHIYKAKGN